MKEETQNWLKLSLEKLLKAIYEETNGNPPKIHNLKRLALHSCGLTLEEKREQFLDILDKSYFDSRYPSNVELFELKHNIDSCKLLIEETKEVVKWLKSLLKTN